MSENTEKITGWVARVASSVSCSIKGIVRRREHEEHEPEPRKPEYFLSPEQVVLLSRDVLPLFQEWVDELNKLSDAGAFVEKGYVADPEKDIPIPPGIVFGRLSHTLKLVPELADVIEQGKRLYHSENGDYWDRTVSATWGDPARIAAEHGDRLIEYSGGADLPQIGGGAVLGGLLDGQRPVLFAESGECLISVDWIELSGLLDTLSKSMSYMNDERAAQILEKLEQVVTSVNRTLPAGFPELEMGSTPEIMPIIPDRAK